MILLLGSRGRDLAYVTISCSLVLMGKMACVFLDFLKHLREDNLESHVKRIFCSLELNELR